MPCPYAETIFNMSEEWKPEASEAVPTDVEDAAHEGASEPVGDDFSPMPEPVPQPTVQQSVQQFLKRARQVVMGSAEDVPAQLAELTAHIEAYPEDPSNYVIRGEVYMEMREYALAAADFQQGYELAEAQFTTADWGFMAQALRDRALDGLKHARRRLR